MANSLSFKFYNFLRDGRTGDQFVYHSGYLPTDKLRSVTLNGARYVYRNDELRELASVALELSEEGYIHLTQRKLGPHEYEYIATKSRKRYNG